MTTSTVRVVMFATEIKRLRKEAARSGLTLSDYIRQQLQHPPMPKGNNAHRKGKPA